MKALLSNVSKMPGKSWGISAWMCKTGEKLSRVAGSTCEKCYARKGFYHMGVVKDAQQRRWEEYQMPDWEDMVVEAIYGDEVFRWFDSGDLQDTIMLRRICSIVERTPETRHWLPTREKGIVQAYLQMCGSFPDNLVVRVSMAMVGMAARVRWPAKLRRQVRTSTVGTAGGQQCPAYKQGGKCLDCRSCWSKEVGNVNYPQH